jgi:hypothetical protein
MLTNTHKENLQFDSIKGILDRMGFINGRIVRA